MTGGISNVTDAFGNAYFYGLSGTLDWNASKSGYFTDSGTVAENATAEAELYEGYLNVTTIEALVSGSTLGPAIGTWTVNTTGGKTYSGGGTAYPTLIYLTNGSNALTLQYAGAGTYYDKNFEETITAPDTLTDNVSGVYDALATITAKAALTGTPITNFTLNTSQDGYSFADSSATTTGTLLLPLEKNLLYNLTIDAAGYAIEEDALFNVTNSTPQYQFTLYTENSVLVNIYDEDLGTPITANITIVVSGANYSSTNYTTTGTFYIDSLLDGDYTFKLSGENYTLKSYVVTVGSRSTQVLNAYLSASSAQTIFTYQDADGGQTLEGVSATMYRLINSTWTVVESKTSDITGRVQFTYTTGVKYKFYSSLTAYEDKVFYLDPVLFSTYTVKMDKVVTLDDAGDLVGVSIIYAPKRYAANTTGNFTYLITSPTGVLISYGLNLTYPGTSVAYTGSNANGGQFSHAYNLSNATGSDTFVVRYWYNSTVSGYRNFTATYRIAGDYGTESIEALKDGRFGLGVLETVIVSIVIVGIVAGVGTMIAGPLLGAGLGLLLLGFFSYIGFVPIWAALITFLVGFLILARKGGD